MLAIDLANDPGSSRLWISHQYELILGTKKRFAASCRRSAFEGGKITSGMRVAGAIEKVVITPDAQSPVGDRRVPAEGICGRD